jgi:hypothetical protein
MYSMYACNMNFLGSLMIVLTIISTSFLGEMAASHAPSTDIGVSVTEAMLDDHTQCCGDTKDLAQSCHVLLGLVPALVAVHVAPESSSMALTISETLLTGIEPTGILDPPRAV